MRAVQIEQPDERHRSSSPPFRGVNTERAERTRDDIGRVKACGPRVGTLMVNCLVKQDAIIFRVSFEMFSKVFLTKYNSLEYLWFLHSVA